MSTMGINMFWEINSKLCKNADINNNAIGNNLIEISCKNCKRDELQGVAIYGLDCKTILWDCNRWGIGINSQEELVKKIKQYLCWSCNRREKYI